MISTDAWQAFGGVAAVVVLLGGVALALKRLGFVGDNRAGEVERNLEKFKVHVAQNYVAREEWVPAISKIAGMLEKQNEMLARLDERTKHMEARRDE